MNFMQTTERKIRILMAKVGLDGHMVGLIQVSRALRDEGFEVILGGVRYTPEQIVKIAIDEDVDVIGISILSGAHMTLVPKILKEMEDRGCVDCTLIVGGVIPPDDVNKLKAMGVAEYFGPGTSSKEIADYIYDRLKTKKVS